MSSKRSSSELDGAPARLNPLEQAFGHVIVTEYTDFKRRVELLKPSLNPKLTTAEIRAYLTVIRADRARLCLSIVEHEFGQNKLTRAPNGCWISGRGQVSPYKDGVRQVTKTSYHQIPVCSVYTIMGHHIAYWSKGEGPLAADMQASHLCDNSACFNPEHIWSEGAQANGSRKNCLGWGNTLHGSVWLCRHEPPCIRINADYPSTVDGMRQLKANSLQLIPHPATEARLTSRKPPVFIPDGNDLTIFDPPPPSSSSSSSKPITASFSSSKPVVMAPIFQQMMKKPTISNNQSNNSKGFDPR